MSARWQYFGLVAASWLMVSCQPPPVPSPVLDRPMLQRPTINLKAKDKGEVLTMPAQALVERGGISGVFVLLAGEARFRMVKVGRADRRRVEVLSGLRGDETLVVGDLTEVLDGSPITPGG